MRTKAASDRFSAETEMRRPAQAIAGGPAGLPSSSRATEPAPATDAVAAAPPPERPADILTTTAAPSTAPAEAMPVASTLPAERAVAAKAKTAVSETATSETVTSSPVAAASTSAPAAPAATAAAAAMPAPAVEPVPAPAATAVAAASPVPAGTPAPVLYKDGVYKGWGTCRHGDIEATVTIVNSRIASAVISQCWTRYPCSWIAALPPQVSQRQSPEVDYVSGATQSTNAFYYAVIEALAKAK
jgi:uncharacterized protein with FMN-binding domain